MTSFNKLQRSTSGLAHALDEPPSLSPPLAQNNAERGAFRNSTIGISPQNNGARTRPEHQAAITILLDQQDDIIFAYLRFARSLNRNVNVQYFSGHGSLSSDQVLAVCALRDCNDNEIKAWLKQARELCETAELALELQELTLSSKPVWTVQISSRRYPSRAWLYISFYNRSIKRVSALS